MENRVAVLAVIVQEGAPVEALNDLLAAQLYNFPADYILH